MDTQNFLLSQVLRILRLKPHQIVYSLSTREVRELKLRVANKRIFLTEDVGRLAGHFHVTPQWGFGEPIEATLRSDSVKRWRP